MFFSSFVVFLQQNISSFVEFFFICGFSSFVFFPSFVVVTDVVKFKVACKHDRHHVYVEGLYVSNICSPLIQQNTAKISSREFF